MSEPTSSRNKNKSSTASAINELIDDEKKSLKRIKQETYLTSGCGYGRAKKRLLQAFWSTLWPKLERDCNWHKIEHSGEEADAFLTGAIYFVPPNPAIRLVGRGKKYYDKIKTVIDVVSSIKEGAEVEASLAYFEEIQALENMAATDAAPATTGIQAQDQKRVGVAESAASGATWKMNRKIYRKISSRVGVNYQATKLPTAGDVDYLQNLDDDCSYDEQVWDPVRAKEAQKLDFVHLVVPHNKKEHAMVTIHKQDYSVSKLFQTLRTMSPLDGSNWTIDEKDNFHLLFYTHARNLTMVAKKMNKKLNNILAYYFGTYKQSDDYRLQKAICVQERSKDVSHVVHNTTSATTNGDIDKNKKCIVCNEKGNNISTTQNYILSCDKCLNSYHLYCIQPSLQKIPDGNWHCYTCIDTNIHKLRDNLLFENDVDTNGSHNKRKKLQPDSILSTTTAEEDENKTHTNNNSSINLKEGTKSPLKKAKLEHTSSDSTIRSILLDEDDLLSKEDIVFEATTATNNDDFARSPFGTPTATSSSSSTLSTDIFRNAAQRFVASIRSITT